MTDRLSAPFNTAVHVTAYEKGATAAENVQIEHRDEWRLGGMFSHGTRVHLRTEGAGFILQLRFGGEECAFLVMKTRQAVQLPAVSRIERGIPDPFEAIESAAAALQAIGADPRAALEALAHAEVAVAGARLTETDRPWAVEGEVAKLVSALARASWVSPAPIREAVLQLALRGGIRCLGDFLWGSAAARTGPIPEQIGGVPTQEAIDTVLGKLSTIDGETAGALIRELAERETGSVGIGEFELRDGDNLVWSGDVFELLDQEGLSEADAVTIGALEPGDSATIGGGAAGAFTVRRRSS